MLTAHHLRISLDVETPIELDEHQGAALRGMLFNALRGPDRNPALGFCTQRHLKTCAACALVAVCPVAGLVATLNPQAERGRDVPRPYAIAPPLTGRMRYEPGQSFTFGLTLFGEALNLFPYVVMALKQAGPRGLGRKVPHPAKKDRYERGRFALRSVQALNLLTGEAQEVLQADSPLVKQPDLPVTPAQIDDYSRRLLSRLTNHAANGQGGGPVGQPGVKDGPVILMLDFKTPTRIVADKKLLKTPHFSPIFHRLLDRLSDLSREFGPQPATTAGQRPEPAASPLPPETGFDKNALLALSDQVELIADQTAWQEVWSYSSRRGRKSPLSGFVGQAAYRAPRQIWQMLLPYLLWGMVVHVGKNAVKGNGIIAVSC